MSEETADALCAAAERLVSGFNLFEGLFWLGVAGGFLRAFLSGRNPRGRILLVAAVFFALFGVSDFVEIQTGAWWRPWWLLAWKAGCIIALLAVYACHLRKRHFTKARQCGGSLHDE